MKKILSTLFLFAFVIASAKAQVLLHESFTYADGFTTNVSANVWSNYSGSLDSTIVGGRLAVFGSRSGDIERKFSVNPGTVYASFIVNSTNLPVNSNYFAHFTGNSGTFKGRVWGSSLGAASNSWRLGVTVASGSGPVLYPLDLATNVDYRVVINYDNVNFTANLWVDPVVSSDLSALAFDTTTAAVITNYSFRQSNSGGQAGQLFVDELYVGAGFSDVNVGAVKPAAIYYQPIAAVTNFSGNNQKLSVVGGGAGNVTFQWYRNGSPLSDGANVTGSGTNILTLVSALTNQSGNYTCVVTSTTNGVFASSATSSTSVVTISAAPVPPTVTLLPAAQTVYKGQNVTFTPTVSGPGTITYQWKYNGSDIVGENNPTLTLSSVTTNNSGSYRVGVSNEFGGVLSSASVLTVTNPPLVTVAYLRSLVDPITYQSTNSNLPFEVIGYVTTYTNLTTGNTASYYLQDGTGGINIFATSGSTFRPQLGDVVDYVGVLSSFSSGLELFADTVNRAYTSYSVLSNDIAHLPAPLVVPFTVTNNLSNMVYNIAGKLVTLTNVYFGTNAGNSNSLTANTTITVTNASGQSFNLFFAFQDQDVTGQPLPAFATSVTGVMYGNTDFSVAVTRWSDINTNVPVFATFDALYDSGAGFSGGEVLIMTNTSAQTFTVWSSTNASLAVSNWNVEGTMSEVIALGDGTSRYSITVTPTVSPTYYVAGNINTGPYVTSPIPVTKLTSADFTTFTFASLTAPIGASGIVVLAPPVVTSAGAGYSGTGGFSLQFSAPVGQSYRVLASTDLVNWTVVSTGTVTSSPVHYTDPAATSLTKRYYRVSLP